MALFSLFIFFRLGHECLLFYILLSCLQELWEENLSAAVSLQVLEIMDKFSTAAALHSIATDYSKLDCITSIFMSFLSRAQPLAFWQAFLPVFNDVLSRHGAALMSRENDRFLKQVTFHLLRLAVFRNNSIRRRAVVGLQLLVRVSLLSSILVLCKCFLIIMSVLSKLTITSKIFSHSTMFIIALCDSCVLPISISDIDFICFNVEFFTSIYAHYEVKGDAYYHIV